MSDEIEFNKLLERYLSSCSDDMHQLRGIVEKIALDVIDYHGGVGGCMGHVQPLYGVSGILNNLCDLFQAHAEQAKSGTLFDTQENNLKG